MSRARGPVTASIEEAWARRTRAVDGGHLKWTGRYTLRRAGQSYSPAAVAFRIRTGRDPQGTMRATCAVFRCVAPDHVDDAAGRAHTRAQIRAAKNLAPAPGACKRGHDQTVHGRLLTGGTTYCDACQNHRARAATARGWVDAAPTRGQLRDLAARGFPLAWIARRIGVSPDSLSPVRAGKQPSISAYTARSINRLHHQLADATSADHGIREGVAAQTRLTAARSGWTERGRAA